MSFARRLLSQSGLLFASRLGGAGVIFLTQAAMARYWGADALGDYLVVIATANIVAVVMPLGFETIGTYFAAAYRAEGDGRSLRRFMARAYGHIAVSGLLLSLVGRWALPLLGASAGVLEQHLAPATIMAIATAVVYCNSALLVGLKRPFAGFFADTIFRPLLMAAVFAAVLAFGSAGGLGALLWGLALGFSGIAGVQLLWLWRAVALVPSTAPPAPAEVRRWWRFALPWAVIALATDFFFDIDLLLLSQVLTPADLAVFGVSARVFSIVAFGVSAVYAVTLPDLFAANAGHDRVALSRQIGNANITATLVALCLFVTVVVTGPLILLLFGPHFGQGLWPLAILCVSLLVRAAFGPAALVLSLHDRPYAPLPAIGLGMAALVGGNLLLVPGLGLLGAASAALLAQSVWAASMWLTTLRLTGLDVSVVPALKRRVGLRLDKRPAANG